MKDKHFDYQGKEIEHFVFNHWTVT